MQKKLKKQQKMAEWQRIKEEKQRAEQEAEVRIHASTSTFICALLTASGC